MPPVRLATVATLIATLWLAPGRLSAQPPAERPITADDVRDAPSPRDASGRLRDDRGSSFGRSAARAVLFVPRVIAAILFAPVRGALWAADRYAVGRRLAELFSGGGPIEVLPAAALESGFGITWGVGATWRDMFGAGEKLRGRFLFGGEVKQIYGLEWTSGSRLGAATELSLDVEAQLLQGSRFWGYGMADRIDPATVMTPVEPASGPAVPTRFDQDALRIEAGVTRTIAGPLSTRLSSALLFRRFDRPSDGDAAALEDLYATDQVGGYDAGLSTSYSELALTYDSSRQPSRYINSELPSVGWHAELFAGAAVGIGDDPSSHLRYGADLIRFIDLFAGDRVLVLRTRLEGVTGDLDRINFVDLPMLGGSRALRAYPRGRFRDRTTTLASAEYRYPVNQWLAGYLFGETGGAWRHLRDVDPDRLRWAGGGGLLVTSVRRFLFRLQIGYGDEGVRLAISFNPSVQSRPRTRP